MREAMEALCGFLNQRGGVIVFGVGPDGKFIGQEVAESTLRSIAQAVREIDPAPQVDVRRLNLGNDRALIAVSADAGSMTPYTHDGRPFIRVGNTTRRMKREEYERLLLARLHTQHRWETLPAIGWTVADLDAEEIRQTVVEAVAAGRLTAVPSEKPDAILRRLNLLVDGSPTQAAVVLFGKNPLPQFTQCAIRLARFRGATKAEFSDNRQFQGHAFALLRHAEAFFDMHVGIASRIVPGQMRREDRPQYPPEALREALVNALCHRDYSEPGTSVGVAIFDDRLEVQSWGRLPNDLTPERLRVEHPSVRRNELIADVFYRRGYIEKWGRGTQKIITLCRHAGLREPDFIERSGEVVVVFRTAKAERDVGLSGRQREVLDAVASVGEASIDEIRDRLQNSLGERRIQHVLATLVEDALIVRVGKGRATRYRLAE